MAKLQRASCRIIIASGYVARAFCAQFERLLPLPGKNLLHDGIIKVEPLSST
jgi:hypothetical protein